MEIDDQEPITIVMPISGTSFTLPPEVSQGIWQAVRRGEVESPQIWIERMLEAAFRQQRQSHE